MLTDQQLRDIYAANLKPRHNAAGVNVGCYVDVNGMMREAYRMGLDDAAKCCDEIAGDYGCDYRLDHAAGADDCAAAIRAIIQEGK